MACDFLVDYEASAIPVSIFSDSQAALSALSSSVCYSKVVQSCLSALARLADRCSSISVNWVPGHCNIRGNDMADAQARLGSSSIPVGPQPFLPVSSSVPKSSLLEWQLNQQQVLLASSKISPKGLGPAQALLDNHFSPSGLGTHAMRILSQVVSGHSVLAYFQHLIGVEVSGLCPSGCASPETSEHVLAVCPALSALRQSIFGFSSSSLEFILYHCSIDQVIRFAMRSGRFIKGTFSGRPPD